MFGRWEIIALIVIALMIFGPKKIPELMRGVGKGLKEFKNSMKDAGPDEPEQDENHEKPADES